MRFANRSDAGKALAAQLDHHAETPNLLILGLPRGGVPVAAEIATRLSAPLDLLLVRKLGLPGHPELAMGAIARGGLRILNDDVVNSLPVPKDVLDQVTTHEKRELQRREDAYRRGGPALDVSGRIVILADDGIATGSTMFAAVAALRQAAVTRIIVAAPVIASETLPEIRRRADEVAYLIAPDDFRGVGQWYKDFSQTSDEEVRGLLANVGRRL